ncbi:MAG TPA: sugar ABC transporter permease [Armatimonadota bacterium]|nr:sugar ABC transporter permease [Armatimonadota bacterium]HOM80587.1 sugar ABC transporter permease [Armatimonadota bacterium]HOQ28984.1 sugar ABC transporter permease [Armatimonadota bacterium]HPO73890.1 sugar ABC transporter permease [Armatimonadota bacterium]HPT96830.1 sugar ABC transporter permease [Armatimonadota bacterium]
MRKKGTPVKWRENLTALAFLSPNLIGFLIFTLLPVLAGFLLSLCHWDLFHPPRFVGLRNFVDLLGWYTDEGKVHANDPRFWKYLGNTFFLMMGIPINMAASLLLAMVLNQKLVGRTFFRTIFFLPTICMGVGVMLLWMWILNPEFGLLNYLLSLVNIQGPAWLKSYAWAKPSLMMMQLWVAMGGTSMILYLAGLQGIPPELYEAADVDGASGWDRFRHITLPLLTPTTFFIFITSVIGGFQGGFDAAYIMTRGGPDGATTTISYYIFSHAFEWFNMGYAAAIAVVLFGLVLVVTLINWRYGGKRVHYV